MSPLPLSCRSLLAGQRGGKKMEKGGKEAGKGREGERREIFRAVREEGGDGANYGNDNAKQ